MVIPSLGFVFISLAILPTSGELTAPEDELKLKFNTFEFNSKYTCDEKRQLKITTDITII